MNLHRFKSWIHPAALLMLAGCLAPAVHAEIKLVGDASVVECSQFLHQVLPPLIEKNSAWVHIGTYEQLKSLMASANYQDNFIQQTDEWIESALNHATDPKSVLFNIRKRLVEVKSDFKKLLICVLEDCSLPHSTAVHVAIRQSFQIEIEEDQAPPRRAPGWIVKQTSRPIEVEKAIVVGRESILTIQWAALFLHEAAHFADFGLIAEWIDANVELLKNSKMPDTLFSSYIKLRAGDETPRIDEGFLRVFLESRAYGAEWSGFDFLGIPRDVRKAQNLRSRQMALEDLQDFIGVTGPILRKYNISERNVFETGERWGALMLDTIQRSQRTTK